MINVCTFLFSRPLSAKRSPTGSTTSRGKMNGVHRRPQEANSQPLGAAHIPEAVLWGRKPWPALGFES